MARPKTNIEAQHPLMQKLFEAQDRAGWSNLDFAAVTDMPPDKLSRFRRNVQIPTLTDLEVMADAFGFEVRLIRPRK